MGSDESIANQLHTKLLGVTLTVTPSYKPYLYNHWDRFVGILALIWDEAAQLYRINDDGLPVTVRYKSAYREANPYRWLTFKPLIPKEKILIASDIGKGSFSETSVMLNRELSRKHVTDTFYLENWHIYKRRTTGQRFNKEHNLWFSEVEPEDGWK